MRTVPASLGAQLGSAVTKPVYLVTIGLQTPLNLSTRETITYAGTVYTAASLTVDLSAGRLSLFNADLTHSAAFLGASNRVPVRVLMVYGNGPWSDGEAAEMLDGELGGIGVGSQIEMRVRGSAPQLVPRITAAAPLLNHLLPDGAVIATPQGNITLSARG